MLPVAALLLALVQSPPAPPAQGRDFPVFVWRAEFGGQPLPPELVRDFGGVNVEGPAPARWAREQKLDFYVGHAPGRNALHIERSGGWYGELWDAYWTHRDATQLMRQPCLSQAATLEKLLKRLRRSAAARGGEHGLGLSLGDEVSLTPWGGPLDLCATPECRQGFRAFLATQPKWQFLAPSAGQALPYPDTDLTRLAWIEGDAQHVGAWLARRAFHHQVLIRCLRSLAQEARTLAPGTPIGLFGQSGRSAFGDLGVEAVLPFLDFLEVYRVRDSRELLYSLRTPQQRSYLTIFRDPDALHGAAWSAWEHWLRGGDGLVLWSDHELLQDPAYHQRLARAVRDLRGLRERCPNWAPRPSGVALIHSPDSLALSWLRDALNDGPTWMRRYASFQNEHGTRELLQDALLRLFEDCAQLPGSLPIDAIDARTSRRFGLLVACELLLLDAAEQERLQQHLAAGGRLLVVGEFGRFDRQGQLRSADLFQELHERFGERVTRFALDPERYLADRQTPPGSYAAQRREALRPRLPSSRAPSWSLELQGASSPWLQASQREGQSDNWLCAALPNACEPEQRARLQDLQVRVKSPPGFSLEWLHPLPVPDAKPSDPCLLPAGDGLVFRLRKLD